MIVAETEEMIIYCGDPNYREDWVVLKEITPICSICLTPNGVKRVMSFMPNSAKVLGMNPALTLEEMHLDLLNQASSQGKP